MFEHEDDVVERVIQELRQPVGIDPALDARVLAAIAVPRPSQRGVWPWLAAAAAVLVAVGVWQPWSRGSRAEASDTFQFVLVAPQASSVSLVGDFNDWDPARAPMRVAQGVWATAIRLSPGRYRYAFLVNGAEWRADPGAPASRDDEFGTPGSVVTVGGKGS